jgi:hypothetical protein
MVAASASSRSSLGCSVQLVSESFDGPCRAAAAEEVVVAGQDRGVEQERQSNGGLVLRIAGNPPPRGLLE